MVFRLTGVSNMPERINKLEKRISVLESNQIEDFEMMQEILNLKSALYDMAQIVAQLNDCSVSEVIPSGVI
jgi:hypothetical protein